MPGLFALLNAGRQTAPLEMPEPSTWPRYRTRLLHRGERRLIGAYLRHRGPEFLSCHEGDGRLLALYGHCADPDLGRFVSAAELDTILARDGDAALDRLEGAFCVLQVDHELNRARLFNDRVGVLATYWHHHEGVLAVAPRLGLLPDSARSGGMNPGAVVTFLSVGHFLGPNTPWRNAHYLTPATILQFDLRTGELDQRRYWNLVYEPDHGSSSREHCRRLGEAIERATALLVGADGEKAGFFLSGGWDSRSLLGASLACGRPPQLVVTNGTTDQFPDSDPYVARRLANDLDLPYRFCRRDPRIGPTAWLDGLHKGEITTANNPENFGQHDLPPDYFDDLDYILKGDVCWGSGSPATSRELSIAKVVPMPLGDNVKSVLAPDLRDASDRLHLEQIESVISHCRNDDWTDRRDYLWQMGGINRYILGLGISDEEHIQVRRPLLAGMVLREYTRVPRRLRCEKNLFIESIRRFYPRLFRYGRNHVSTIAHYYHYMAPFVRERTLAHLAAGHDLDGLLDAATCRTVLEAFAPALLEPRGPGLKARIRNRLRDRYGHLWHRNPRYREKHVKRFQTSDTMLAFHLYLLLEWHHGAASSAD